MNKEEMGLNKFNKNFSNDNITSKYLVGLPLNAFHYLKIFIPTCIIMIPVPPSCSKYLCALISKGSDIHRLNLVLINSADNHKCTKIMLFFFNHQVMIPTIDRNSEEN